jgi:hypothetical protein
MNLYCGFWESNVAAFIVEVRKKEHNYLQKIAYCQSLSISVAPTIPVISAVIMFLAHIGAGNSLTAAQVLLLQCAMPLGLRETAANLINTNKIIFLPCGQLDSLIHIYSSIA